MLCDVLLLFMPAVFISHVNSAWQQVSNACQVEVHNCCWWWQSPAGLRNKGFLRKVEAWWGPVTGLPLPDNFDGPLRAVRVTFSDEKQSVVRELKAD